MTESDERLTCLIENDVYATYHTWIGYIETDPNGLEENIRAFVQDTSDYGDGRPMHVELDGHGLFEISVSVKRLPRTRDQVLDEERMERYRQAHEVLAMSSVPDDVEADAFAALDEEAGEEPPEILVDVEVRADKLAEGDQIFSPATGQWHEVISASTYGTTTLVIDRNNGSTFQFKIRPEQIFKARRGPAGLLIDALGGEVIHSA